MIGSAATLACCTFIAERSARADSPPQRVLTVPPQKNGWFTMEDNPRDAGFFRAELLTMRWTVPQFGVNGDNVSRRLVGIATPSNPATFYGVRGSIDFRWGPVFVQGLELTMMQTAGGVAGPARANGAGAYVQTDSVSKIDLGINGIGFQAISPSGRFKLAFKIDWGTSWVWSSARVTELSGNTSSGDVNEWHFYARTSAAACHHFNASAYDGAHTWACLTVAPNIWEDGWLNGVAVGGRVDF